MEEPRLEMRISLNVLEHLGLKMYASLPAVIAEYVANSWDAGATEVDITVPEGPVSEDFAIQIEDNGGGMSVDDLNEKFLVVGRDKRLEEGTDIISVGDKTRPVIGRKGIGKLAGFGVAGLVRVDVHRDGKFVSFTLDYDAIKETLKEKKPEVVTKYQPEVLRWGETKKRNGTVVRLKHLKRQRAVSLVTLRRKLARHFSVIGTDFAVSVNEEPIVPAERELRGLCEWVWELDEFIDEGKEFRVKGWIGTTEKPTWDEDQRAVVVLARGKLVETPKTFDVGAKGVTGQAALSYLVGEVNADFLDDRVDLIATGRRSVVWERYPASELRTWLNKKISEICAKWVPRRREKKLEKIRELPIYRKRIERLPPRDRKMIDDFLYRFSSRQDVTPEAIVEITDYVASGVELKGFLDLVDAIESADVAKPEELLQLFEEWEVLDAVKLLQLFQGRMGAIEKFQELIASGVREVPEMHNFLADNPWLLDPTWDYFEDEVSTRKKLLEKFPEKKDKSVSERRIDFLCLSYGRTLNVVELKRPGSTIGMRDLNQLESYVYFVRELEATDPKLARSVIGYIIGGKLSKDFGVRQKAEDMERNSLFFRPYERLPEIARLVYREIFTVFERKARRTKDFRIEDGLLRVRKRLEEPGT